MAKGEGNGKKVTREQLKYSRHLTYKWDELREPPLQFLGIFTKERNENKKSMKG